MPFAQIYMLEGRTEEQKRAVIEKVSAALVEATGAPIANVRALDIRGGRRLNPCGTRRHGSGHLCQGGSSSLRLYPVEQSRPMAVECPKSVKAHWPAWLIRRYYTGAL